MRGDHIRNLVEHAFIELAQICRRPCGQAKSRKKLPKAGGHAEQAWIRNTRCQPLFARGSTNGEIAAEAPSAEGDTFWIYIGQGEREIDHRSDDRFPVRPQAEALQDQHLALARPVEDQAVIAPSTGGHGGGKISVGDAGIIAVGQI